MSMRERERDFYKKRDFTRKIKLSYNEHGFGSINFGGG